MFARKPLALSVFLTLCAAAPGETPAKPQDPIVMAPVAVTAGPLGYLGLTFDVEVDVGLFSRVSDRTRVKTLVIAMVTKGSPAYRAGILPGDLVLMIDGVPTKEYTIGTLKGIRDKETGDKAEFVVSAPGTKAERTVVVTYGAKKPAM